MFKTAIRETFGQSTCGSLKDKHQNKYQNPNTVKCGMSIIEPF